VITSENVGFGPIQITRKAYDINSNIPHYGYIGQQVIYNNIPNYNLRVYKGINDIENLI
jgi:hypothetical protein